MTAYMIAWIITAGIMVGSFLSCAFSNWDGDYPGQSLVEAALCALIFGTPTAIVAFLFAFIANHISFVS